MGLVHSLAFPKQEDKQDLPIIDVEEVLGEFAWDTYVHSYSCFRRRFIKRKNFTIEVPMNYYYFEQGKLDVKLMEATHTTHGLNAGTDGSQDTSRRLGTPEMIGLETRFNNDTENEQKYNFNFQKERTASVEVTYQTGYSIGGKANFTIGIPKILGDGSMGAEIETHVEVTKTTGERHEEKVTTSATSEITVAPHSHYTASVVMEERTLVAKFTMPVTMKLPTGRGVVYIKVKKTGDVSYIQNVTNLPFYFLKFQRKGKQNETGGKTEIDFLNSRGEKVENPDKITKDDPNFPVSVRFTVEGVIKGIQLSSHCINLKQTEVVRSDPSSARSPDSRPRDPASSATSQASGQSERSGAVNPRVSPGNSLERTHGNTSGVERVLQVVPDATTSRSEQVMHFVERRARDGVSVHFDGGSIQG